MIVQPFGISPTIRTQFRTNRVSIFAKSDIMNNLKICASDCFDCETSFVSQFHENCTRTKLSCHAFDKQSDKQQNVALQEFVVSVSESNFANHLFAVCETGCFACFAKFCFTFRETIEYKQFMSQSLINLLM